MVSVPEQLFTSTIGLALECLRFHCDNGIASSSRSADLLKGSSTKPKRDSPLSLPIPLSRLFHSIFLVWFSARDSLHIAPLPNSDATGPHPQHGLDYRRNRLLHLQTAEF